MAQGFDCFCGAETCKGFISGAKQMEKKDLEGVWLNSHIRGLLDEQDGGVKSEKNGKSRVPVQEQKNGSLQPDATETALLAALKQAEQVVEAAKHALSTYVTHHGTKVPNGDARENGVGSRELGGETGGDTQHLGRGEKRRGVTSREMSGEMGGDTSFISLS